MSEIRSQATPARDELVHILAGAVLDNPGGVGTLPQHAADRIIAAGWSKPRTVNSAAELDALPVGSVIRSEDVTALKARNGAWLWDDGNYWEPLAGREVRVLFTPGDAR